MKQTMSCLLVLVFTCHFTGIPYVYYEMHGLTSVAVGESSGKASKGVAKYSAGAGMAQAEQRAGGAMSEIAKAKQVGCPLL